LKTAFFFCLLFNVIVSTLSARLMISFSDSCTCNGKRTDCYGFKDEAGRIITAAKYQFIDQDTIYSSHYYAINCNGEFLAIDSTGKELFTIFPFDNGPDYASEGLFRYIENGKIGFADTNYAAVIKAQYDFATPFNHGLSAFCVGCKKTPVYSIDHKTRKETIEEYPEHCSYTGGKWGFINAKNEVVVDPVLDPISSFDSTTAITWKNNKKKTINLKTIRKDRK